MQTLIQYPATSRTKTTNTFHDFIFIHVWIILLGIWVDVGLSYKFNRYASTASNICQLKNNTVFERINVCLESN